MEINLQQHIADVTEVVCKTNNQHSDTGKIRHGSLKFHSQWVTFARRILHIRRKGVGRLARHELKIHSKNRYARPGVGTELD